MVRSLVTQGVNGNANSAEGAAHVNVFDQQSRAVGFLVILPHSKSTVSSHV